LLWQAQDFAKLLGSLTRRSGPAIIRKDSRKAGAVLAPNQNIENNPMQSSRWSLA
jgi:hypothetical protein